MQKVYPSGLTLKVERITFTKDLGSAPDSQYEMVGVAERNGASQVVDVQLVVSKLSEVMAECIRKFRSAELANKLSELAAYYSLSTDDIQKLGEEMLHYNAACVLSGDSESWPDYFKVAVLLLLWQRAIQAALSLDWDDPALIPSLESALTSAAEVSKEIDSAACIHCGAALNTLQDFIDHYGEKSTCRPEGTCRKPSTLEPVRQLVCTSLQDG